jgi:predicted DNA-binding protein (UPF0251 family)
MTTKRTLNMSKEEIRRCEILRMAEEKQITQKEGAKHIGISPRLFKNAKLFRNFSDKINMAEPSTYPGDLYIHPHRQKIKKD